MPNLRRRLEKSRPAGEVRDVFRIIGRALILALRPSRRGLRKEDSNEVSTAKESRAWRLVGAGRRGTMTSQLTLRRLLGARLLPSGVSELSAPRWLNGILYGYRNKRRSPLLPFLTRMMLSGFMTEVPEEEGGLELGVELVAIF